MPSVRGERVLEYLRASRAEIYHLLQRLVEAESPSGDPASQEVPLAILAEGLEATGYRVVRTSGTTSGGVLIGIPRERVRGRQVQVLIGHCDTVWPQGTLREMPITLRRGKMTGPGVYDMKGGLVLGLYALRALSEVGIEPEVTPIVFVNSDEEVGSGDSKRLVERFSKIADRVFVMEPAFGRRGKLKTARKGVGQFTIRVKGKAAHAGLAPGEGVSAILELSLLVQKLFALNDPEEGITVNVGTIDGGMRPNVVAPESSAKVDVRVVTMEQARRIEEAIHGLRAETRGATLTVEGGVGTPPLERTPRNRRLWRVAREVAAEIDLEIGECRAGGGSDGNTASLHTATLDGLGAVGGGAHAVHEFIQFDSLIERGALLALLVAAPPLGWRRTESR